jgi:hypothetical protein
MRCNSSFCVELPYVKTFPETRSKNEQVLYRIHITELYQIDRNKILTLLIKCNITQEHLTLNQITLLKGNLKSLELTRFRFFNV